MPAPAVRLDSDLLLRPREVDVEDLAIDVDPLLEDWLLADRLEDHEVEVELEATLQLRGRDLTAHDLPQPRRSVPSPPAEALEHADEVDLRHPLLDDRDLDDLSGHVDGEHGADAEERPRDRRDPKAVDNRDVHRIEGGRAVDDDPGWATPSATEHRDLRRRSGDPAEAVGSTAAPM